MAGIQYVFIVSKDNGLVLGISTGEKKGNLVLMEADARSSQLWRRDDDCRIVSKLGLVADIEGKKRKAGTKCHAWKAHDGLNQKWQVEEGAIKSKLNGLVIDSSSNLPNKAVTMQDVNGKRTQKWYFVPENAWDNFKLQMSTMVDIQYFFIVSKDNGLVLGISTGEKKGNLVLMEADAGSSQLWKWDEDCRLVSKLGLVADIYRKKRKAGTKCHAWDAHDGLNQKWRVEEEAIKSNLNGLVIDSSSSLPNNAVTMQEGNGKRTQKWYFVPENAWDDFKLVQANPNPLSRAQFWKNLADNYLDVIVGYNIDDYEQKVKEAFEILDECSNDLDKLAKDTSIARTVGGGAAVAGGGMAVAGLFLAPITFGATFGLTIAGIATSTAGGLTSLTSDLASNHLGKYKAKKAKKITALASLFRATYGLQGFLSEYNYNLKEAAEFLKTPEGKAVANDASTSKEVAKEAGSIARNAYKVGNAVYKGVKNAKKAKQIKALVEFLQADYYTVKGARVGLAIDVAAPEVTVPIIGKTIVAAGTTGAKALSGSMAFLGIAFGIFDIVQGARKIKKGSELAEEFRKSSKDLKEESGKLIKLYKELQQEDLTEEKCSQEFVGDL